MRAKKERLTVTVDNSLIAIANEAVRLGRASSLSAWVNLALEERAAKEERLRAMAGAVAFYEREFGVISEKEIHEQRRADRRNAVLVATAPRKKPKKKSRIAA